MSKEATLKIVCVAPCRVEGKPVTPGELLEKPRKPAMDLISTRRFRKATEDDEVPAPKPAKKSAKKQPKTSDPEPPADDAK